MRMKYVLGIDGGGLETTALCADETGQIVGRGHAGPASLTTNSIGAAGFNLREAVRQAIVDLPQDARIARAVMGVAGLDTATEKRAALEIFRPVFANFHILDFLLFNDSVIALAAGATQADALILISGTGSICFGRNQAGQTAVDGGLDQLLTDQGSGFWIGRSVLRTAARINDGRAENSVILSLVKAHFQLENFAEIKGQVYNPPLSKREVAGLAEICFQAATENDQLANEILEHAGRDLLEMAKAVAIRLHLWQQPTELVLHGKTLHHPVLKSIFEQQIQQAWPQASLIWLNKTPVEGALRLALGL